MLDSSWKPKFNIILSAQLSLVIFINILNTSNAFHSVCSLELNGIVNCHVYALVIGPEQCIFANHVWLCPSLQSSYFHLEVKTVRENTYETNKVSLNYLNMATIQSATCEHHWVCAIVKHRG